MGRPLCTPTLIKISKMFGVSFRNFRPYFSVMPTKRIAKEQFQIINIISYINVCVGCKRRPLHSGTQLWKFQPEKYM